MSSRILSTNVIGIDDFMRQHATVLAQAPHRVMFFVGASNVLLAMAWWAMWLLDMRWQLFGLRQQGDPLPDRCQSLLGVVDQADFFLEVGGTER